MATLPCFNSDSLNLLMYKNKVIIDIIVVVNLMNSDLPGGERPRGSKNPKGPETPASLEASKAGVAGTGAGGGVVLSASTLASSEGRRW